MFRDYQINLENTAKLNSTFKEEGGGRRYSKFPGRERILHEGTWCFMGNLITLRNHILLSYPYNVMSGYLCFPSNLKDIKGHI